MVVAVEERYSEGRNMRVIAYRLKSVETGETRLIKIEDVQRTIRSGKVQVENLELTNDGHVRFKGINYKEAKRFGLMAEEEVWKYIHSLNRENIVKAEIEITNLMRYGMKLEKSIQLRNSLRKLHGQAENNRGNWIAKFMSSELGRCSDDQLTDFIYAVIWVGKNAYYSIVYSESYEEMKDSLSRYTNILIRNDGELFGYATDCTTVL